MNEIVARLFVLSFFFDSFSLGNQYYSTPIVAWTMLFAVGTFVCLELITSSANNNGYISFSNRAVAVQKGKRDFVITIIDCLAVQHNCWRAVVVNIILISRWSSDMLLMMMVVQMCEKFAAEVFTVRWKEEGKGGGGKHELESTLRERK